MRTPTVLLALACLAAAGAPAQTPTTSRTERAFAAARKAGAPALYAFLKPFPKGADLHMHFSGAVYAETFIANAIDDNLCVDPVKLVLAKNVGLTKSLPPQAVCAEGNIPAATALKDNYLYDKLINSFSLRSFVPYAGWSGHDQFFSTFDHFSGIDKSHQGQWLAELTARAAAQNEQYLEIMTTPSFGHVFSSIANNPWPADFNDANHMQVLSTYRDALFAAGLRDDIAIDSSELASVEASRSQLQRSDCLRHDLPENSEGGIGVQHPVRSQAACTVRTHWLYQVLRGFPPAQVFAQTLLGFELASQHPEQVVGINFVRAEDRRDAMAEYHTEMLMLDYLHSVYPKVRISLHAGELAPGIVPPDGLAFHIREALDLGHAERIGHGVDVLHEDRPADLLKQMAKQHTMVEINLTSNDGILGVRGADHPLHAYMAAHVPWALSTDDEGVSRSDLTHEYVRAVLDQGLTYADLKQSARTALEHSFLRGESLYSKPDNFAQRKVVCASASAGGTPTAPCRTFLKNNEKAAEQYKLERRIADFERMQR